MSERLMLKGALQEKKMQRMGLATKADGLIRAVRNIIQPAVIVPIIDIKTGQAKELITELDDIRQQIVILDAQIAEIMRELGE